jgi:hypothetical protein
MNLTLRAGSLLAVIDIFNRLKSKYADGHT